MSRYCWHFHLLLPLQMKFDNGPVFVANIPCYKYCRTLSKGLINRITKHMKSIWMTVHRPDGFTGTGGILFLFSNESVQDSDGGHKEWYMYLWARRFDKDRYTELLQRTGLEHHWSHGFTVLYCTLVYYMQYMDGALKTYGLGILITFCFHALLLFRCTNPY